MESKNINITLTEAQYKLLRYALCKESIGLGKLLLHFDEDEVDALFELRKDLAQQIANQQ